MEKDTEISGCGKHTLVHVFCITYIADIAMAGQISERTVCSFLAAKRSNKISKQGIAGDCSAGRLKKN